MPRIRNPSAPTSRSANFMPFIWAIGPPLEEAVFLDAA